MKKSSITSSVKEKNRQIKIIDFAVIIERKNFLFIVRNYVIKFKSCETIKFLLRESSMSRYEAQIELHHRETAGSNASNISANPCWYYHLSSLRTAQSHGTWFVLQLHKFY